MKKIMIILCTLSLSIVTGCSTQETKKEDNSPYLDSTLGVEERIQDLMGRMTLEDKVGQMIQGERQNVLPEDIYKYGLGSVLSGGGSIPGNNVSDWTTMISDYQDAANKRKVRIPVLYGIDAVHGHNNVSGATIFPHNIGLGAANDPVLMEKMGEVVGKEMLLTGIPWDFAPTVALAMDSRWGRTYESFSTDPAIITSLSSSFSKGLMNVGVLPTMKHFIGDGATNYGTGLENKIDRGDVTLSLDELRATHLKPYEQLIKDGVPTVMASYSSFEGVLMHENKYLLTDLLKGELQFKGFVVSDYEAIHAISGTFQQQVEKSINAGIDMLMEPNQWKDAYQAILSGVNKGTITKERIDDAVYRILKVKFEMGLFEDPKQTKSLENTFRLHNEESKTIARQLVEKSSVLLKNENNILPLNKEQLIYLTGPGANNIGMQCGGWTMTWQGDTDHTKELTDGTSIYEGLKALGYNVTMDPKKSKEADVVVLVVGEKPYAEMKGDVENPTLYSELAHPQNKVIIPEVKALNKPTVTILLAGRHLDIRNEIQDWDSVIMSYLPGTEGDGIANLLTGTTPFTGKLARPWIDSKDTMFDIGYGLEIK